MALIIAGDRSGVGKTTITLAILAALVRQGKTIQSFKVGPDYIDPMFHSAITGIPCRNLDSVLTSTDYVKDCFARHTDRVDGAIVEGVMGLFDGISLSPEADSLNDFGSTAQVARILNLPVALVLDCSRLSGSIAAIASGYANLDPRVKIAGVILNRVASDRHLELLETALKSIKMNILGVFRRNSLTSIPDRHLGLIPTNELPNIQETFDLLADTAQTALDWQKLVPLVSQSPSHPISQSPNPPIPSSSKIKIAVARDRAFNFYYQDNLDLLQELGSELIYWSPIEDKNIPLDIQGLYFGGGFPEVFAPQLAANKTVLQQLKKIILAGIPTYAECGGLMYLCQKLSDLEGKNWAMVGAIPTTVKMQGKLTLGYRQAIALQDSCLMEAGQRAIGHEFHHSQLTTFPESLQWHLKGLHKSSRETTEGWNIFNLHASYLHLHWGKMPQIPQRFIKYCHKYKISLY